MKMPVPDDRWTALGTTIIYTTNMAAPPPTLLGSILEVAAGAPGVRGKSDVDSFIISEISMLSRRRSHINERKTVAARRGWSTRRQARRAPDGSARRGTRRSGRRGRR